jgi:hypothetical protein
MIHDVTVPAVDPVARPDGHAQFGAILPRDAALLSKMGTGNNVPGNTFTVDGKKPHFPGPSDRFPDVQSNVVPIYLSMGAFNSLQQSDAHAYWEFNYLGTNWVHPLYELPFTGGFADRFGAAPDAFEDGEIGKLQSIVPGSGPSGVKNDPRAVGDDPNLPRDPDKFDGTVDAQREFRQRGIPSGLANEIFERFAVTREINDGLLAPRFSPSQRAYVLSGTRVAVSPPVPASAGRDADDR